MSDVIHIILQEPGLAADKLSSRTWCEIDDEDRRRTEEEVEFTDAPVTCVTCPTFRKPFKRYGTREEMDNDAAFMGYQQLDEGHVFPNHGVVTHIDEHEAAALMNEVVRRGRLKPLIPSE